MKILALSDGIVDAVYSPQILETYGDVNLVISCGDLPYFYLEFIATMLSAPVVYVYGNHDNNQYMSDGRIVTSPEGCTSLDGRVIEIGGLLLAGLGGSMRYNREGRHQYSEVEMRARIAGLLPALIGYRVSRGRRLDILVTHSPAFGIHDGEDLPHRGFKSFLPLLRYAQPQMMLHGHTHLYQRTKPSHGRYHRTTIMNVYPLQVIEWPPHE